MEQIKRNIMITGGCGFIGSHLVRLFVNKYPHYHIINVDALTYAGNMENLKDIAGIPKPVPKDDHVLVTARNMGINLGD